MDHRDIAHRLHDGPVQDLTAAMLLLGALGQRLPSGDGESAALAERALVALEHAAAGCRAILRELDPDDDDP